MKINGQSIQGIFIFSPGIEYEEGDIVLYNKKIYIRESSTKNDNTLTPENNPEDYSIYLKEDIFDPSNWKGYEENYGNGEDKLISVSGLKSIISEYLTGFDGEGNIKTITEDGDNITIDSLYGSEVNAIYYVKNVSSIGVSNGILKQFKYKSGDSIYIVQEIIDLNNGLIWTRSTLTNKFWSCSTTSGTYKKILEEIYSNYLLDKRKFESFEDDLNKRFKYICIYHNGDGHITSDTTLFEFISNSEDCYTLTIKNKNPKVLSTNSPELFNLGPLTIDIVEPIKNSETSPVIYKNYTVTVNLADEDYELREIPIAVKNNNTDNKLIKSTVYGVEGNTSRNKLAKQYYIATARYYIDDDSMLIVRSLYNKIKITISNKNMIIRSIYYRKYYK